LRTCVMTPIDSRARALEKVLAEISLKSKGFIIVRGVLDMSPQTDLG